MMRKIQIERTLFELFGHKFLVFERFEDGDLNIDDKTIYNYENPDTLVDIFVINKFYAIWSDERRHNSSVICACYGNLTVIVNLLKKISIPDHCYSTFNCHQEGEDRVLYITSQEAMQSFVKHLSTLKNTNKTAFFRSHLFPLKKKEISPSSD
ncbi:MULTISPECIES: hypothetical protein [Legionella]|uniref:Uncharacterized protein n=1 Tax=Legionella maceachernii TaxID=466 RepID=A0A0W0W6U5_9GAMM|nr:hypothetical protein [Legionella maceachernii]KTD28002.1 hypothetical protein Lmac_1061 [Legionella maceachernii]SKA06601.1 hypothetical protein SAMN02745128_01950 [Legionella maceachernii]SUO99880.1 Uncharacterised protein [Legionella maceachernii]